ncbi:MAG: hypothetical protein QX197_04075 [Methylococcaceae bacterium]
MNQCSECGCLCGNVEKKCPQCSGYYAQIEAFLTEEGMKDNQGAFSERVVRVMRADDRKRALLDELRAVYRSMPKGSVWILYLVMTFVFALFMVVL